MRIECDAISGNVIRFLFMKIYQAIVVSKSQWWNLYIQFCFVFKETILSFGSNYSFQISIQLAIMFESVTKLAIKVPKPKVPNVRITFSTY